MLNKYLQNLIFSLSKKFFFLLILFFPMLGFSEGGVLNTMRTVPPVEIKTKAVPAVNQYVLYISANDWGAGIDKIVINCRRSFTKEQVHIEDFEIHLKLPITSSYFSMVDQIIIPKDVFISDSKGNKSEGKSKFITLEFSSNPDDEYSDPFVHSLFNILTNSIDIASCAYLANNIYDFQITNNNLGIIITDRTAVINELAGQFKIDSIAAKKHEICLEYAYYESTKRKENEGCPLVIWLHGMGEIGSNPYLPVLGTKATNLISENIQQFFPEGFDLVIPQAPLGWLETTDSDMFGTRIWAPIDVNSILGKYAEPIMQIFGMADNNKQKESFIPKELSSLISKDSSKPYGSTSYFTVPLKKVIDTYISEHPYIDKNRIYIGGCSAGGYMTMNMIIEYPDFFAAAFPTCEVYPDSKIKDVSIDDLKNLPIWFTHSKNDTTVDYKTHSEATYNRLKDAGSNKVHISLFEDVHDLTGKFKDEEGNDKQYPGHYSWIYVLNNECREKINGSKKEISLFEWLSKQKK